jgi:hypothetical protein
MFNIQAVSKVPILHTLVPFGLEPNVKFAVPVFSEVPMSLIHKFIFTIKHEFVCKESAFTTRTQDIILLDKRNNIHYTMLGKDHEVRKTFLSISDYYISNQLSNL